MKKGMLFTAILISTLMALAVSCSGESDAGTTSESLEGRTLSILTFTGEFRDQNVVADFEERTGATVELEIVPTEQYESKIRTILKSGTGIPDLFVGEAAFVREFVDAGIWENLSAAPYNADVSDQYPYVGQMGTASDGTIRGLAWQATPGGWFYRRSVAKEYFGTDDPAEIGKIFSSWESVLEAAETLKQESGGAVKFFPGIGEGVFRVFFANRSAPWIDQNDVFTFDPEIVRYMETAKYIRDNEYDAKLQDWSGPFFSSMNTPAGEADTFVFGWPTWGLQFVLAGQKESFGDWAVASPPTPWFWGGTWLGIWRNSENKDVAWEFIKMMTQDEEYMKMYALRSSDFTAHQGIVDEIKGDISQFNQEVAGALAGQNFYEYFASQTGSIDVSHLAGEDQQISLIFQPIMNEFLEDKLSLEEAIAEFKARVKTAYPNVTVN